MDCEYTLPSALAAQHFSGIGPCRRQEFSEVLSQCHSQLCQAWNLAGEVPLVLPVVRIIICLELKQMPAFDAGSTGMIMVLEFWSLSPSCLPLRPVWVTPAPW